MSTLPTRLFNIIQKEGKQCDILLIMNKEGKTLLCVCPPYYEIIVYSVGQSMKPTLQVLTLDTMKVQKGIELQSILDGSCIYYKLKAIVFWLPHVVQGQISGQRKSLASISQYSVKKKKNPVIEFLEVFTMHLAGPLVVLSIKYFWK